MNDVVYSSGDIVVIEPGESTDFRVLSEKCTTCVVKIPGAPNDKYLDQNEESMHHGNHGTDWKLPS